MSLRTLGDSCEPAPQQVKSALKLCYAAVLAHQGIGNANAKDAESDIKAAKDVAPSPYTNRQGRQRKEPNGSEENRRAHGPPRRSIPMMSALVGSRHSARSRA